MKEDKVEIPLEFTENPNVLNQIINTLKETSGKLEIKDSSKKELVRVNKRVLDSPEFKSLWERVKYRTTFSVDFDSDKLIKECMSTSITKDALADLTLQELIIRIIQTQTAKRFEDEKFIDSSSPISPSIDFIKKNIRESISLKDLSDKACMSTTSFYRYFKRELGMSPIEYILNEKIKHAKKLLSNPNIHVNEVSYASGFEDCNYFIRLFKKYEGVTPKQYQLMNFTSH